MLNPQELAVIKFYTCFETSHCIHFYTPVKVVFFFQKDREKTKQHTCNSCVAVPLLSGFFIRHCDTKSLKGSDHWSGFRNVGGGFVGIMNIACFNNHPQTIKQLDIVTFSILNEKIFYHFIFMTGFTLIGCMSAYGGFPSAISIAVMPRDQISATQL